MPRDRRLEAAFADVAAAVWPDEALNLLDAARAVLREDATLRPEVVGRAAPQTTNLFISGTTATGTAVGTEGRIPADAIITRIDASAKTPPSGGEFTADLTADGTTVADGTVSIADGMSTGGSNVNTSVTGGAWLRLNVTAANGAADVSVTVTYRTTG